MNDNYWNDDKIVKLINLVRKSPPLWHENTSDPEKDLLWEKIVAELGMPLQIVHKKYLELVCTYSSIRRKKNCFGKYDSTWKYYKHFRFLEDTGRGETDSNCSSNVLDEASSDAADFLTDSSFGLSAYKDTSNDMPCWTDKKKVQLIQLLESNPKLLSKSTSYEEALWKQVASKLGFGVDEVKTQKKLLCKRFSAEHRIASKDPNFKSSWKYYDSLKFLTDFDNLMKSSKQATQSNSKTIEPEFKPSRSEFKVSFAKHWNCEKTIKFIKLVHTRHVIWDDSNSSYVETTDQRNAWEEIAKEMNLSVDILKNKFKSLCSTYYSIRKEIAKDPLYVIGWIYFSHMKFLPLPAIVLKTIAAIRAKQSAVTLPSNTDILQNEAEISSIVSPQAGDLSKVQKTNSNLAGSISDVTVLEHDEAPTVNAQQTQCATKKQSKKQAENVQEMQISSTSKNSDITNLDENAVEISDFAIFRNAEKASSISEEKTTKSLSLKRPANKQIDEYDIFGEVVANEMRKMCDFNVIQKTFKKKVNQALFEARKAAEGCQNIKL